MDPPYAPATTQSFVGYVQNGFNLQSHMDVFNRINELNARGVAFAMSNAAVPLVLDNLAQYNTEQLHARRAIHPTNPGTSALEVLIWNTRD